MSSPKNLPNQSKFIVTFSPFILEINFLKNKVIEDKEITRMKEKDLALIFPNVKPEHYKDIVEG